MILRKNYNVILCLKVKRKVLHCYATLNVAILHEN